MAKAVSSPNANPWPAEGLPLDAACKLIAPQLWDLYERARDAARDISELFLLASPGRVRSGRSVEEERRLAAHGEAKAALDAQLCADVEQDKFELWLRPGDPMAKPEVFLASEIRALRLDYERRRAELEGRSYYDARLRKPAAQALLPVAAPVGDKKPGRQVRRVLRVLPELYPPDGEVLEGISTETVRQRVITVLDRKDDEQGLTGNDRPNPPSWRTINRALGREK